MMVRTISILSFIFFFVQAVPAESREVKKNTKKQVTTTGNYFVKKEEKNFSLLMEARRFTRGEVIFLRLTPKDKKWINESYKVSWLGKDVILTKRENSLIAFLPISPDTPAGAMTLEIVSKIFFVKRGQKQYQIILEPTKFQVIKKTNKSKWMKNLSQRNFQKKF